MSVIFAEPVIPSWASGTLKVRWGEVSVSKTPMYQVPFFSRLAKGLLVAGP
jgi:hypothetical protein